MLDFLQQKLLTDVLIFMIAVNGLYRKKPWMALLFAYLWGVLKRLNNSTTTYKWLFLFIIVIPIFGLN